MNQDKLHPSVMEFKTFLNKYPALIKEVRKSGSLWQEYYEKWIILGENDPVWDKYKDKQEQASKVNIELFDQMIKFTESVDIAKVQKQVSQLNNTINMVQEILSEFLNTKKTAQQTKQHANVFDLFRD